MIGSEKSEHKHNIKIFIESFETNILSILTSNSLIWHAISPGTHKAELQISINV